MSDSSQNKPSGGFHFGSVGGAVTVRGGGDVVGGDKTTTTTITTTITKGFAGEDQKLQFQQRIVQLREALSEVKSRIEGHPALTEGQKMEMTAALVEEDGALEAVDKKTAATAVGESAPPEVAATIEAALDPNAGIAQKLQHLAAHTGAAVGIVGEFAGKFGPLLLGARHLFGLP